MVAKGRGSFAFIYGNAESRYRLFSSAINWDRVLLAYLNDDIVGFLAFQWKKRGPYQLDWGEFSTEFGCFHGTWRWLVHTLLEMRTWHRNFYIYGLKVEPTARRKGVATALLHHTETHARTLGARMIELDAYESNQAAIELYQANQFHITKTRKIHFLRWATTHTAIIQMNKNLM